MIRVLLAPLLAFSLSGCVAAMAVGAATSVVGAAARSGSQPAEEEIAPPIFHGYGENPAWAVTVYPESIVFYTAGSSATVPTPPSITTEEGHLFETGRITLAISHQNCRHTPSSREFTELVRATVDGTEYVGCGTEGQHLSERDPGQVAE